MSSAASASAPGKASKDLPRVDPEKIKAEKAENDSEEKAEEEDEEENDEDEESDSELEGEEGGFHHEAEDAGRILTEEQAKVLSEGFLGQLTPMIEQIAAKLTELQHGQVELLGQFQDAGKLVSHPDMDLIMATLSKLPQYYGKLKGIYEEMIYVKEKTNRMKKRAIKMQRKRQEDEVKDETNRRKVSLKEEQLTAKFVESPAGSSSS